MAIEPAVGRDVRRDVPTPATEIGREYPASAQAAGSGRRGAHQNVLLMAMNDVRVQNFRKQRGRQRIVSLTAYVPSVGDDADVEIPESRPLRFRAERHKSSGQIVGHVTGKLERVSLRATENAGRSEKRRHQVEDTHYIACSGSTSSSICSASAASCAGIAWVRSAPHKTAVASQKTIPSWVLK